MRQCALRSWLLCAVVASIPAPCLAQSESGFYLASEFGVNVASELTFQGFSEGGGGLSVCDEYINPRYAELPECLGPQAGGTVWSSVFDRAAGVLSAAAVGYRRGGRFRVELEYFYRDSAYDQTSPILGESGATRERLSAEVERAREHVYSLTSHSLFGNVYFDFANGSRFTPYVGFGAGTGFTALDNAIRGCSGWMWPWGNR